MTVLVSKPVINIREKLTALKAQCGYEEQQFYFDNLLTNGGFDSDTIWTKGTDWTIASGVATKAAGAVAQLTQPSVAIIGVNYRSTYTLSNYTGSGSFRARLGSGSVGQSVAANGTYIDEIPAAHVDYAIQAVNSSCGANIDDTSLFLSDGTDVVHYLPRGWLPTQVFVDGLLLREGVSDDYTVHSNGFDTWIKPAVAPTAATQTCIIGVRA